MSTRQGTGYVRPSLAEIAAEIVAKVTPQVLSALAPLFAPQQYEQRTAPQGKRRFLALVREFEASGGTVTRDGRRVVVDAAEWDAWIRQRGKRPKPAPVPVDPEVEALAAELGLTGK